MLAYHFTIYGNQEKADGNPLPYFRSTQGSFFNAGSRRYQAWKDYVRKAFFDAMKSQIRSDKYNILEMLAYKNKGKPIVLEKGEVAEVSMLINWKNGAHADGDNVFKGINDALFHNDKMITKGSFESKQAGRGSVLVEIVIKKDAPIQEI